MGVTRILGIDPGLTRCGFGVIDVLPGRKVRLVEVGVIRTGTDLELADRIGLVGTQIAELLDRFEPTQVAIERVYAEANLISVMGVAQVSGVVLYLSQVRGIPTVLHTPTEVKAAVTGSGKAEKSQVGAMVAKILGLESVPKPADAADALAIAICSAWRNPAVSGEVGDSTSVTPAQKAWQSAIRASRAKPE